MHAHVLAAARDERAVARDRNGEHAAGRAQRPRAGLAAVSVEDPQRAVVRGRDDPVPVRRERERVDGRRVAVQDGEQRVAGGEVPGADRLIFGGGVYPFAGDADGENRAAVADELVEALVARSAFPDGDFCACGSRDDQFSSARVCHVVDGAGVPAVRGKRVV